MRMRCFSCHTLSLTVLCNKCRYELFKPTIKIRQIGTLSVVSFYRYSTIESLLLSKHKPEGFRIFKYLAKITTEPFVEKFLSESDSSINIIGVDEKVKNGYSHVACLTKHMKRDRSTVLHSSLISQNSINYAGKSLQYRMNNPRDFSYSGFSDIDAILVDDIITTGITLQEAERTLRQSGVNVLFALTIADAKE